MELDPEQQALLQRLLKEPARVERLLKMADEDEKREWLFIIIRKTAAWVATVLGALILFWEQFKSFVRGIVQ